MKEPIMIDCEGGGYPGHDVGPWLAMCTMCGEMFDGVSDTDDIPRHQRQDILAMLDRGDFG